MTCAGRGLVWSAVPSQGYIVGGKTEFPLVQGLVFKVQGPEHGLFSSQQTVRSLESIQKTNTGKQAAFTFEQQAESPGLTRFFRGFVNTQGIDLETGLLGIAVDLEPK